MSVSWQAPPSPPAQRDAALARVRRITWWSGIGAAALTVLASLVAATTNPGRSTGTSGNGTGAVAPAATSTPDDGGGAQNPSLPTDPGTGGVAQPGGGVSLPGPGGGGPAAVSGGS